jgi:hypothetical protein
MNDDDLVLETADVKTCPHRFVFWTACKDCVNTAMNIIYRASIESCCLCRDKCLTCDAKQFLKELRN